MTDPFEVRLRFTSLLSSLSASQTSSAKAASYALRHRDLDEDLHSCILETLTSSSTSVNTRANIMYFLEHFCESARKEGVVSYVEMVGRDVRALIRGVVCGGGASSAAERPSISGANIKVVRRVMSALESQGVIVRDVVVVLEDDLKRWEERRQKALIEEGVSKDDAAAVESSTSKTDERSARPTPRTGGVKEARQNGTVSVSALSKHEKRAIEQRIEEDRERNKRLRESVWAVNGDDMDELDRLWEETSDLCEEDYAVGREEMSERRQFAGYHRGLLVEGIK